MSQSSGMSKKARFSVPSRAQETSSRIMQSVELEELVQEIPIDMLEQDPDNRPLTKLNLQDPETIDPADPHYILKTRFLQGIREMAQSIRSAGRIEQPLRVYKRGAKYRIVFGERRALGAALAGRKSVPAIIEPEAPADLEIKQAIENVQREDVLPWERVLSIKKLIENRRTLNNPIDGATDLSEVLGLSKGYASKLLALLEAPEDVVDAMRSGRIDSVTTAYEIAKTVDPASRAVALQEALDGAGRVAVAETTRRAKAKHTPRRGRKRAVINLGRTADLALVKRILAAVGKPQHRRGVEWNNLDQVQSAWDRFLAGE